jgi:erythromycin esterase-like protein
MAAVVEYLDEIDPDAARRARERYACFDQFGRDPQVYACEAGIGSAEPCEQQAVEQLMELFDIVVHIDETSAVEPLERTSEWEPGELPETFPWGV